jgi:hypothetical protein
MRVLLFLLLFSFFFGQYIELGKVRFDGYAVECAPKFAIQTSVNIIMMIDSDVHMCQKNGYFLDIVI